MNIDFDNIDLKDVIPSKKSFHKKYGNIYISENDYEILKSYGFEVEKYSSVNDLIFDIEEYLESNPEDDLDQVSASLQEFNYYNNTNK